MAAANTTSQCLVHAFNAPIITGMRCCCQADEGYQVSDCGAIPTTMALATGSGPTTSRSRAASAAKKPLPGRRNRDYHVYASCTENVAIQGDLHQPHIPRSSSRSSRADHETLHPGFAQLPSEIWGMITSASQEQLLPSQDKEIGEDCMVYQRYDAPNLGHDFILFDDSTRLHFAKNRRGRGLYHDDNEMMDSIGIDDATEKKSELTPHLQRSPPPRPRKFLTPDFSDDEETATFFEPLDMVEERQRKSRNGLRRNEERWSLS